ncbi:hypothetical protein [Halorubellus litoreus]|uniref:PGF-CTERM protein n=1 Tax=Halorubellus litoreus TaxID=755308 RepID=A0ABD5VJW0_9EURY
MADKKFTIFELHFDGDLKLGPTFGADPSPDVEATDGGTSVPDDDATDAAATPAVDVDPEAEDAEGGSKAPVKGAILGVLALVLLAVAARVLMGGDDDVDDVEMVDLDDVDAVED